jgi:hypothetical protein
MTEGFRLHISSFSRILMQFLKPDHDHFLLCPSPVAVQDRPTIRALVTVEKRL